MSLISTYYTLFVVFSVFVVSESSGTGKVYIGDYNTSRPSAYSFTVNSRNGTIPVYALVFNDTTGETTQFENDVQITCELTEKNVGFSTATFFAKNVSASTADQVIQTRMDFDDAVSGRAAELKCWGESVGFDPADNPNSTLPQFTKSRSISDPVSFEIRSAGTVNFCDDVIVVPKSADSQVSGKFQLQFSETVKDYNVTVRCAVIPAQSAPGTVPMNISIPDGRAFIGEAKIQMSYQVRQAGHEITVSCTAQSDGGVQFLSTNSNGTAALFVEQSGTANLYPYVTAQKSTSFKAFLVLDSTPEKEVTFTCQVRVVQNIAEALQVAQDPVCKTIEDVRPPTLAPVLNTTDTGNTTSESTTATSTSTTTTTATTTVANSTFAETSTITGTTTPLTTVSSTTAVPQNFTAWSIAEQSLIFRAGKDLYKTVEAKRSSYPLETVRELVVVTCCAPPENNDPIYTNKSAAMLAVSYLNPVITVNWTAAPLESAEKKETLIQNPAFVDLSPCPCDMTISHCDTNCCCDKDCSSSEIATFTCIPGIRGGYGRDEVPYRRCYSNHFNKADWFPLMCVEIENNALLGLFYQSTALLRNSQAYEDKVKPVRPPNSYRETGKRNTQESGFGVGTVGYKDGLSVKTADVNGELPKKGNKFRLSLPQQSFTGQCFEEAPVRYLRNFDNNCLRQVTQDICSVDSPFNARIFALATTVTQPPCLKPPYVLREHLGEEISVTVTNYLCAGDATEYLKQSDKAKDYYTPNGRSLFNYNLPKENATRCYMDTQTGALKCDGQEGAPPALSPPLPQRCSWDNSHTLPPVPTFNNDTKTCENAVIRVHYNFTWSSTKILQLNATYILGNLPISLLRQENRTVVYSEAVYENRTVIKFNETTNTTYNETETVSLGLQQFTESQLVNTTYPAILPQNFRVDFSHSFNQSAINNTNSDNKTVPIGPYERSGMPGYGFDKPVISGVVVYNQSTGDFIQIDTSSANTIRLLKPNLNGLCVSSTASPILFGANSISSCVLRLTRSDLNDCDYLRKLVLNRLDTLVPSDSVGKLGDYPDRFKQSNWIQVFREDLSSVIGVNPTVPPSVTESTTADNNTSQSKVTAAITTESTSQPSNTTESVNTTFTYTFVDQLTGYCSNITNGIKVDIMYAEAGKARGLPIYEIVGAKISYSLTTWEMSCSGSDAARCYDNSSYVQSYVVSSSVNFIQVPAQEPVQITKFQADNTKPACEQNACWERLAFPLTRAFTGDTFDYNLSFGLVTIIFLVGVFFISRPWW